MSEIKHQIEDLSKLAMKKLNHGSQSQKMYAIGMLKVLESVRILIRESKDDVKLLNKIKKIFE